MCASNQIRLLKTENQPYVWQGLAMKDARPCQGKMLHQEKEACYCLNFKETNRKSDHFDETILGLIKEKSKLINSILNKLAIVSVFHS